MADQPQGRSTFFTRLLASALIAVLPLLALQLHELLRQKRLDEAAVVAQLQARVERSSVGFEAAIARIESPVQFVATRPELQQRSAAARSCAAWPRSIRCWPTSARWTWKAGCRAWRSSPARRSLPMPTRPGLPTR